MKKIIGIPGWSLGDYSFGVTKTYLQFASKFNSKPKILLPDDDIQDIDLLLLPGGLDINPRSFGQVPGFETSSTDVYKQYFYDEKLPKYVEKKTPIFGICLGFQQICSFFGGELTQDLPFHEQSSDRWKTAHKIFPFEIREDEFRIRKSLEVNSHHHQGLLLSGLKDGNELVPLFYSKNEEDDNNHIVEVVRHKNLPIYGVQYHPEELYDILSYKIINKLLWEEK